jgi:hypothetical protein
MEAPERSLSPRASGMAFAPHLFWIRHDPNDPDRREFTATGGMSAGPENYYAPKSDVSYEMWNRLRGVHNPIRTGVAPESDPLQEFGAGKAR